MSMSISIDKQEAMTQAQGVLERSGFADHLGAPVLKHHIACAILDARAAQAWKHGPDGLALRIAARELHAGNVNDPVVIPGPTPKLDAQVLAGWIGTPPDWLREEAAREVTTPIREVLQPVRTHVTLPSDPFGLEYQHGSAIREGGKK